LVDAAQHAEHRMTTVQEDLGVHSVAQQVTAEALAGDDVAAGSSTNRVHPTASIDRWHRR
jgi:hypothetical protein